MAKSHETDLGQEAEATTHFGFETVLADEKAGKVRDLFGRVAEKYDLMNDALSFGLHRLWKQSLLDQMAPRPTQTLLDCAGGTGDVAEGWLARGGGKATIFDMNVDMVRQGHARRIDRGQILPDLSLVIGNAESLPFDDNSFDHYSIAFGLRNVTRIDLAISEAHRVLKPGGRFFCLEFSKVALPFLSWAYDRYSFQFLPLIGQVVAGDRAAYQYLAESIRRFPDQPTLQDKLAAAGFWRPSYRNLSGGIVAIHWGWKL